MQKHKLCTAWYCDPDEVGVILDLDGNVEPPHCAECGHEWPCKTAYKSKLKKGK